MLLLNISVFNYFISFCANHCFLLSLYFIWSLILKYVIFVSYLYFAHFNVVRIELFVFKYYVFCLSYIHCVVYVYLSLFILFIFTFTSLFLCWIILIEPKHKPKGWAYLGSIFPCFGPIAATQSPFISRPNGGP